MYIWDGDLPLLKLVGSLGSQWGEAKDLCISPVWFVVDLYKSSVLFSLYLQKDIKRKIIKGFLGECGANDVSYFACWIHNIESRVDIFFSKF